MVLGAFWFCFRFLDILIMAEFLSSSEEGNLFCFWLLACYGTHTLVVSV